MTGKVKGASAKLGYVSLGDLWPHPRYGTKLFPKKHVILALHVHMLKYNDREHLHVTN